MIPQISENPEAMQIILPSTAFVTPVKVPNHTTTQTLTPSVLEPGDLKKQLKRIRHCFNLAIDGLVEV